MGMNNPYIPSTTVTNADRIRSETQAAYLKFLEEEQRKKDAAFQPSPLPPPGQDRKVKLIDFYEPTAPTAPTAPTTPTAPTAPTAPTTPTAPTAPTTPTAPTEYNVVKGDTLSKIAKQYGYTVEELAKFNNISNPNFIKVNQKILLPPKQETPTTTPAPTTETPSSTTPTPTTETPTTPVPTMEELARQRAQQTIAAGTENIQNFLNQLQAQREQGIRVAETGAEQGRQALENQMFQQYLQARQSTAERGLAGSGLEADVQTRLGLARQQELSNLFADLANKRNQIEQDYTLTASEKQQELLNLQNSEEQLYSQYLGEAQAAEASRIEQEQKNALEYAKVMGYNPMTGEQTQASREFEQTYRLKVADLFGKDPITGLPTLKDRELTNSINQAVADRLQKNEELKAKAATDTQKAAIEARNTQLKNLQSTVDNALNVYKQLKERLTDKSSQAEKDQVAKALETYLSYVDQLTKLINQ